MTTRAASSQSEWHDYRVAKTRLIILLLGWMPFGALMGIGSPVIFGSYTPAYVLAIAYTLFIGYSWLMYAFYPCPNCGNALRGRQLFHSVCKNCDVPINQKSPAR
jgi:hypothetical protein